MEASVERGIYDPIHGLYSFPLEIWSFIDTPVYQRLRNIKQLGAMYYVFPGATHCRFEHCLGVGHLAGKYMETLRRKQPSLEISNRDIRNVTLAGIMHDLGHGPFSHVFDRAIVPALGIEGWTHERASIDLLQYSIDTYNIDIDAEDIDVVSRQILGNGSGFKYQIVNNSLNTMDVDKFDYIARDSYNIGFRTYPSDIDRIFSHSKVVDDNICYEPKIVHTVYGLLTTRVSLFQQFYHHKVSQAIELMITDVFVEAEQTLGLKEKIVNPAEYYRITDNVLDFIALSDDCRLRKAKAILDDLSKRKLYKMVGERVFSDESSISFIDSQRISSYNSSSVSLKPEDLIVTKSKIVFGNPDTIWFYDKNERFLMNKEHMSNLLPKSYCDVMLRVFVRNPDKLDAAKEAFSAFCKREL